MLRPPLAVPAVPFRTILVGILVAAVACGSAARAANEDMERAKAACERMKARQAEVEGVLLGEKGGERNDGLLEPMNDAPSEAVGLIEEENRDREAAYAAIARATATPIAEVKERRAADFRERLDSRVWRMIPKEDGTWVWSKGKGKLPPRLLTRPGASLRSAPDGDVTLSPIDNFTMFEVIDRAEGAGGEVWYQVSENGTSPSGWIRETESLEWHQALVMEYTPLTSGRHRVLFFDDKEELRTLADMRDLDRAKESARLVEVAERKGDPGRSVIGLEPVSKGNMPMIIPILDHEMLMIDGVRETRLLRLAAATRSNESEGSATLRAPLVDIVFVMDTTSSMGPYLEETKRAVAEFAAGVGGPDPTIRFGVVAYRDSDPAFRGKMEYTVRNFTPTLVSASELEEVLSEVKALPNDPGDPIPEDVFSGVAQAASSSWRSSTPGEDIRVLILVGDASGNDPYTPGGARNLGNESGLGRQEVRNLLDHNRIRLNAIHIKDPKYKSDHAKAETDFSDLARNPGGPFSRHITIDFKKESFAADIRTPFDKMAKFLTEDKDEFVRKAGEEDRAVQAGTMQPTTGQMFGGLLANAYVEWVGGQNRVPLDRDLKGWVVPDDLAGVTKDSMEVRVMLKRPELENLKRRLDGVLEAANDGSQTGGDFFDRIQMIPGNTIRNPAASEFAEVFDFPAFVDNLPYRSRVLGMRRGQWESMSESKKTEYINDWRGMSIYYGTLLQDRGVWRKLSSEGEEFVMIPLTSLP
jgi:serine/threonine-protein kinase PpkA